MTAEKAEAGEKAGCTCPCHQKMEAESLCTDSVLDPVSALCLDPVPTPCQDRIKTDPSICDSKNGVGTGSSAVAAPTSPPVTAEPSQPPCTVEERAGCKERNVRGQTVEVVADEDFRKPKKRYRTPGGVVLVRVKVRCLLQLL